MSRTITMTVDQVQKVASVLTSKIAEMDKVISAMASAHSCLAMDDIMSLENYSIKLHASLLRANAELVRIRNKLEQLNEAMKTAASSMAEADGSEGRVPANAIIAGKLSLGFMPQAIRLPIVNNAAVILRESEPLLERLRHNGRTKLDLPKIMFDFIPGCTAWWWGPTQTIDLSDFVPQSDLKKRWGNIDLNLSSAVAICVLNMQMKKFY